MNANETTRRIALIGLTMLGIVVPLLAISARSAYAVLVYGNEKVFGTSGAGDGQFKEPADVAVDDASGDLYVYGEGIL